jgi:hypothetical protein
MTEAPAARAPMTGAELVAALERLGISQAMLARRISAEGGRRIDPVTINRYATGKLEIPAIFAAYVRVLDSTLEAFVEAAAERGAAKP